MTEITANTHRYETALEDAVVMVVAIAVRRNMQRKNPSVKMPFLFY